MYTYYKILQSSAQCVEKGAFVNAVKKKILTNGISRNIGFQTANSCQAY